MTRAKLGPELREAPSRWGLLFAGLAIVLSFTPSLLPRSWLLQGAAAGVSGGLAYGFGVLAAWTVRRVARLVKVRLEVTSDPDRWVRQAGVAGLGVVFLAYWVWAARGQARTAELVRMDAPPWWQMFLALALGVLVATLGVQLGRVLRVGSRAVAARVPSAVPRWGALVAGVLVVGIAVVWGTNAVLVSRVANAVGERFYEVNSRTREGVVAPTLEERSGGPGSLLGWDTLGQEGQVFVTGGPSAAEIHAVTGLDALEPIRVYGGLGYSESFDEIADGVVAELHRTGAFERSVLVVYNTTGTGWVNEWSAQPVEYLTGGDSAIAAMQYSYLPSPLSLIADRVRPPMAGKSFFDRVYAEWVTLPEDSRPRLMVAGESLGSFGGHGAFTSKEDMVDRVDGAVWIGTPAFTPLWRSITNGRQLGSPEVAPVVDNGRHLRFVTRPADLEYDIYGRPFGEWEAPRIAYLQHASDPISRWDTSLLWSRPDWITERAGTDVNRDIEWFPLVTFWQITTDQALGNATAPGHGHLYHHDLVLTWAAVLGVQDVAETPVIEAIQHERAGAE